MFILLGGGKNIGVCMQSAGKRYFSQVMLRLRAGSVHLGSPLGGRLRRRERVRPGRVR